MNDTEGEAISEREIELEENDMIDNEISNLERSVEEADNAFEPIEIAGSSPKNDENNITLGDTEHEDTE